MLTKQLFFTGLIFSKKYIFNQQLMLSISQKKNAEKLVSFSLLSTTSPLTSNIVAEINRK
jgi:hypothetical protein